MGWEVKGLIIMRMARFTNFSYEPNSASKRKNTFYTRVSFSIIAYKILRRRPELYV